MCDPALGMMALSLAVSTASAVGQHQDQKDQAKQQTRLIEDGYARDQAATQRAYAEQQAVSMEDTSQRHREALIEEGRLKAIGAESGLQGVTNNRIVGEANNQADRDYATIEANRQRSVEQLHTQLTGKQSQANTQMASVRKPSSLGTGLQIAGGVASAVGSYYAKTPSKDPKDK